MKTIANEQEFMRLVLQGVESWRQAGVLLVAMLKKNPRVKEQILKNHPELSASILATFEKIGRGELHPMLLLSESPGYIAARKLPYSDQERIVNEKKVELLLLKDGRADVINADVRTLTAEQAKQAFDKDHVRTPAEQRLYLEDKARPSLVTTSWIIEGDTVRFRKGVTLSVRQLTALLEKMIESATLAKHQSDAA